MKPTTRRALSIIVEEHLLPFGVIAATIVGLVAGLMLLIKLWIMFPKTTTILVVLAVLCLIMLMVWAAAMEKAQREIHRDTLWKDNDLG